MLMKNVTISTSAKRSAALAADPSSGSEVGVLLKCRRTIGVWLARSRQRHALANLEDHSLKHIGVSRAAAATEAAKPFWRR